MEGTELNYIIYGDNKVEKSLYKSIRYQYNKDEVFHVKDGTSLTEALKLIRFKPFFNDKWFITINLDTVSQESFQSVFSLLANKRVQVYMKVVRNKGIYASVRKSKTLNELENLRIMNAQYPDLNYIMKEILDRVKNKYFGDSVLKYIAKNLKFNIEKLDEVIEGMNDLDFETISLQDVRKILPPSKSKNIRVYCYNILLAKRDDLKSRWREIPMVSANADTKVKPYQIIENVSMDVQYLLDLIIKTFKDIIKIKEFSLAGIITDTSIFDTKEELSKKYPILKSLSIPTIRDYLQVSEVVTKNEMRYCLGEFMKLKADTDLTMENIYFLTFKLMNRHKAPEEDSYSPDKRVRK